MERKLYKIILSVFLIIISICSLTSCKNPITDSIEIEDMDLVTALGIDKGIGDKENVRLSIISERITEAGGKNGDGEKASYISTCEGKTLFDTLRMVSRFHKKKLFWGHIKYVLISEDIAKDDILSYLDLIMRDHEIRLGITPIVVKGSNAEEVFRLGLTSGEYIPDIIKALLADAGANSMSLDVKLSEAISIFDSDYSDVFLPYIEIVKIRNGDTLKKVLFLNGFAVFNGPKLAGFMSDGEARGVNWINNKIKTGILVTKDSYGGNISLEIIDSEAKIKTEFKNDLPEITIKIKMSSNIAEVYSQEDIFTESELSKLEKDQENLVKGEVESAAEYAQKNGIDILGFGDAVYHQHPLKWKSIKDKWKTIFPGIKVNVLVESKINRVYLLKEPVRSESGESK